MQTGTPLEIDALLEVTSSDSTGPLPAMAVDNAPDNPFVLLQYRSGSGNAGRYFRSSRARSGWRCCRFDISLIIDEGKHSGEASEFDYGILGLRSGPVCLLCSGRTGGCAVPDIEPFHVEQDIPAVSETMAEDAGAPAEAEPQRRRRVGAQSLRSSRRCRPRLR